MRMSSGDKSMHKIVSKMYRNYKYTSISIEFDVEYTVNSTEYTVCKIF